MKSLPEGKKKADQKIKKKEEKLLEYEEEGYKIRISYTGKKSFFQCMENLIQRKREGD